MAVGCRKKEEEELDGLREKFKNAKFEDEQQEIERIVMERKNRKEALDNKQIEQEETEKILAEKENRLIDKAIMLNNKEDELNHSSRKISDKDSLLKRGFNELNANRHILFKKEAEFERKEGEKL